MRAHGVVKLSDTQRADCTRFFPALPRIILLSPNSGSVVCLLMIIFYLLSGIRFFFHLKIFLPSFQNVDIVEGVGFLL